VTDNATYDAFLSHSHQDAESVEALARRLEDEAGLRVWLDRWHLIPGEPWQEELEEALDACQAVAVFLGPSGIRPWQNEEMRSALEERVRDAARRVIPVLLPGAPDTETLELPRFLRRLTWVDMRAGLDDEEAFHRLVAGIKGKAPGRGLDKGETGTWPRYWQEGLQRYLEHMRKLHSTIRVLGHPRPVPLEGIYTDLYILDRPSATRRFDIDQVREDPSLLRRGKRVNGLEFIAQPEAGRLFILGQPGAGKTTFLRYVALQAAKGKLDRIPIFVSLREWSDSGKELMSFIARQFEMCGFPNSEPFVRRMLDEGQAIALFDGLDEVSQEGGQRGKVIDALRDFSWQYLDSQCLITCRIAATEYQFGRFTYVEVADFTDDQVQTYVYKWFTDDPAKGGRFLAEITRSEQHRLRELSRTPLLLSMLCLAFGETESFPQRRADIYGEALDALLKRWDSARNVKRDEVYHGLSVGRKRKMLALIAAETFERGEHFLAQEQLERQIADCMRLLIPTDTEDEIDGEAVLKSIEAQHGILVERAHCIYSFAHPTLQEYLAAAWFADSSNKSRLYHVLREHMADDHWRDVLLLTVSVPGEADLVLECFAEALDDLICKDVSLTEMLRWAQGEATIRQFELKPVAARGLCLANALDLAVNSFYEQNHTLEPASVHTPAHARDPDAAIVYAHILARAGNLAAAVAHALDPNYKWADDRITLYPEYVLPHRRAIHLAVVRASAMPEWELTEERVKLLTRYLLGCWRYVECLDVANLSNREGLRDRLLRAPVAREVE
jgi:hypothetical protein